VVTATSERVEVDIWLIGGRCVKPKPKLARSSSNSCALTAEGDEEDEGMCECESGEVNRG
jgi:hypothetical protein